jgi:hypothetical protein
MFPQCVIHYSDTVYARLRSGGDPNHLRYSCLLAQLDLWSQHDHPARRCIRFEGGDLYLTKADRELDVN